MSYDKDKYEVTGEAVDERSNTRTIYLRDRRTNKQHHYVVPDYSLNSQAFDQHNHDINWIGILMAMFAFLTLIGAVSASWVTMSERMTKVETMNTHVFKDHTDTLNTLIDRVDENEDNLVRDKHDVDSRLQMLVNSNREMHRQINRIEDLVEQIAKEHDNDPNNRRSP